MPSTEIERDLQRLEAELKQLVAEYNMYFAGQQTTLPWKTRSRVAALVRQYDRTHIQNYGDRFRFQALQARFASFIELWDRGLRARDEGRAGPFVQRRPAPVEEKATEKIRRPITLQDPLRETSKLKELYDSVIEAQREVGQKPVAFDRFADAVDKQVRKLASSGTSKVTFRVAVKDGAVNFTARASKEDDE